MNSLAVNDEEAGVGNESSAVLLAARGRPPAVQTSLPRPRLRLRRGEPQRPLEPISEKRALLALATGSGKTFIAVHLLRKIADAGQLRRALFVCDRDELRAQGLAAFQNVFGADAAPVSSAATRRKTPQS